MYVCTHLLNVKPEMTVLNAGCTREHSVVLVTLFSSSRLITGGRDGSLKNWDSRTLSCMHILKEGRELMAILFVSLILCQVSKAPDHLLFVSATSAADEVLACTYAAIYSNRYKGSSEHYK